MVWPRCRSPPYTACSTHVPPRPSPWLMGRQGIHAAVHRHRALSVGLRCIAFWQVLAMQDGIDVGTGRGPEPLHDRVHLSPRGEIAGAGLPFQLGRSAGECSAHAGGSCHIWLRDYEQHRQSARQHSCEEQQPYSRCSGSRHRLFFPHMFQGLLLVPTLMRACPSPPPGHERVPAGTRRGTTGPAQTVPSASCAAG